MGLQTLNGCLFLFCRQRAPINWFAIIGPYAGNSCVCLSKICSQASTSSWRRLPLTLTERLRLAALGDRLVHTAVRAPDMNAFIERWIRSIKEECLNHSIYLSEAMLREHVETYLAHYNAERPHQGIGNRPVGPWEAKAKGRIVCDQRLNGLLTSFRRAA